MLTAGQRNSQYSRIVESIKELPSLPTIVTRLMDVVNSPDTSAEDAAHLIEMDPALTTKMLRLANSAFYGIPRTISSISSAVVILGFNTIRSVALSATMMKIFSPDSKRGSDDYTQFWRHSIVCAMTAKDIAHQQIATLNIDPESAFCAGILHDIGKLIFMQFLPEEYTRVREYAASHRLSVADAETMVLGMTHAQIGSILADKWALPLDLEYSLVYHHGPQRADMAQELVTTVHMADSLSHAADVAIWAGEFLPQEWEGARTRLGIDEKDYEQLLECVRRNTKKSGEFFTLMQ
jgi:putative nucleotidyltransferase with HDIG domain